MCVCVLLYIRFLALNKETYVARRSHLLFLFLKIDFPLIRNKKGVYLRTLGPPVVFYRIFIPCAILSTKSSKQRLTFLLDRQVFASLSFDLVFMFCLKNLYDFAFA